jgi:hypothetical protein
MITKVINRLLRRRHFWRHATFSEVAELYASRMLRMLAIHLTGGFASVYLYQQGYSLEFIGVFWACFYLLKISLSYFSIRYIARFGPKRGVLLANILSIPAMLSVASIPQVGFVMIISWAIFTAISASLSNLSHVIHFSRIKSVSNAGKEISFMSIFEKAMAGISPLIGGMIALVAGPEATMVVAAFIYTIAAFPLLMTRDPSPIRQKLIFKGFPWRITWRVLRAEFAVGFEVVTNATVWPIFLSLFIIGATVTNETYAVLGILSSVTIVASIIFARIFGKLVDARHGGEVLRYGVIGKSLVHVIRPTATSVVGAGAINVGGEIISVAQQISFTKGVFDTTDASGRRLVFFLFYDMLSNFGASMSALVFFLLVSSLSGEYPLYIHFYVTAVVVLLIAGARFTLYKR